MAEACFRGPLRAVSIRVAELGDAIYIDLCNDAGEASEISTAGWRVVGRTSRAVRAGHERRHPHVVSPVLDCLTVLRIELRAACELFLGERTLLT